jgi:hypothetical protein
MQSTIITTTTKRKYTDDDDDEQQSSKRMKIDEKHFFLPNDVLFEIMSFLEMNDLLRISLVSTTWHQLSSMDALWGPIYISNGHLNELVKTLQYEKDTFDASYNTFISFGEGGTWNPSLVDDVFGIQDPLHEDEVQWDLNEIFDNFGEPLVENSIEEQFDLLKDEITAQSYMDIVKEKLGVSIVVTDDKTSMKRLCCHEKRQMIIYMNDTHKALQDEYNGLDILSENEEISDEETQSLVKAGIQKCIRRAATKYYEPEAVNTMHSVLKNYLESIIQHIYNTKIDEHIEQNDLIGNNEVLLTSTEYSVNAEDVLNALVHCNDHVLHGPEVALFHIDDLELDDDLHEKYLEDEDDVSVDSDEENIIDFPDLREVYRITRWTKKEVTEEEENIEEEESDGDDDDFIDDTDVEQWIQSINVNNLGDTLEDELLKVSIRVHEQVYGKEKAHKEQLYLKNWFISPNSTIFQHALMNDEDYDDSTTTGKTEKELIEIITREDQSYYFHDEDEDIQVDGTEYQLRKLLREESFKCIHDYFSKLDNYKFLKHRNLI